MYQIIATLGGFSNLVWVWHGIRQATNVNAAPMQWLGWESDRADLNFRRYQTCWMLVPESSAAIALMVFSSP
ncbi:hypothetical protein [Geitlerinema calcuttense]|uniref:Uncharacterized protein n=1 Tax=Geitlerinema calcuttense NRMC-F 0142 TaxID=2922238 RepID=A0ABT7LWS0_9CYAN|nr:hypothetical protein [Geitlerinema calcuttense]MDI9638769.1 hypothetical protein [Geitlerinema splendidum]MDL5056467.1 hypothetical protein [Geitlerinema calcuttense NRMC-F 0142]